MIAQNQQKGQHRNRELIYIVGIGASAGGLEAMLAMFPYLSLTNRIIYLIAQHMAPDGHAELMVRLLNRISPLPVVLAKDGDTLQIDRIHMIPSGRDGRVLNGRIKLSLPTKGSLSTPSVNVLFSSIAEEYRTCAVGIMLSGTRSDGVAGCRIIKANGGATIAQDPKSAKFNGMPVAAIEAGIIDKIVKESDIAHELYAMLLGALPPDICNSPINQPVPAPETKPEFLSLIKIVLEATGVDFSHYKQKTLERRLKRRLATLGITTLSDYLGYMEQHSNEPEKLQHLFLVSISSFYRDRDAFCELEKILGAILKTKQQGDAIKIWVAGCATGEEVYTYAIILSELLGEMIDLYDIYIIGTDLNPDALATAQIGCYKPNDFREMNIELVKRYFVFLDQHYQVKESLRAMCRFELKDILKEPPKSSLDVVSCRNLLIYLESYLQDQLIRKFYQSLLPHGLLFLGQSESLNPMGNSLFTVIDQYQKLYRKRRTA